MESHQVMGHDHPCHGGCAEAAVGGQLNIARQVPGKEEFDEMLRYFRRRIETTGWIHRSALKHKGVRMLGGVNYEAIGDQDLPISRGEKREDPTWLACHTVVLCAGQLPHRPLAAELQAMGRTTVHVIGGALQAGELDAKRAIDQAAQLAARI